MDLQRILNSKGAGIWALRISQALPPTVGFQFATLFAGRLARLKDLPIVKAIRLNRWVTSDYELQGEALDLAVRETLQQIAVSYYLLFRHIDQPDALQKLVKFSPEAEKAIAASQENRHGMLVTGVHMSNFDLVIQAAGWSGLCALAISLPEETENLDAVEWQHRFRRRSGIEIVPASISTLRQAIKRMRQGGVVMTGVDRPVERPRLRPVFFGQPASLPVHYVPLALEADAPVILMSAMRKADGKYHIHASPEMRFTTYPERDEQTLANAGRLLEEAERFIRQAPEQWSIFQPAWPELLAEMP